MNPSRVTLAAVLLVGFLSAAAVSRANHVADELPLTTSAFTPPEPTMVVAPTNIPGRYRNAIVPLSLELDAQGRVLHAGLHRGRDRSLERHLLPVVAQWQFKPALRDGRPVPVRVVLPVELVENAAR